MVDTLRANGSNIMGGSAAAMEPVDMREHEIEMNKNLHLVPCRWERSGWRYVQKDPADEKFFKNPNRVNNFGVNADKKRFASSNRESFYRSANKSAF